jgi:tetratricopeptide (TPR) repeat protein
MWFERGNAHAAQREYDEALADWEQALELSPGLPPVLLARADLRTHTGELEAAEEDLEAVLEVLPDYPVTYRLLGWCRYLAGDFEAAVAAFTRSLEERPKDRRTLVRRGLARWELGRSELALADFAAAHRANPERLFEIGAPVRLATEPGAALERYRQRLEADGDDPASWLLVANALQRLGRLDEAEAALGSALELAPTSALARLERGVLRQRLGRSAEALEDFDAALAEDGGLARALNNRGILRAEAGELEAARADYEAASEADPTFAWPLANLALLLAEREPTAALALLGRALDLSPDYADAYEARAVLYDRAGNHPAARRDRELAGRARGE